MGSMNKPLKELAELIGWHGKVSIKGRSYRVKEMGGLPRPVIEMTVAVAKQHMAKREDDARKARNAALAIEAAKRAEEKASEQLPKDSNG